MNLLIALVASSFDDGPGKSDRGLLLFPWLPLQRARSARLYLCMLCLSSYRGALLDRRLQRKKAQWSLLKHIIYFTFYVKVPVAWYIQHFVSVVCLSNILHFF